MIEPWEVFDYELDMFHATMRLCSQDLQRLFPHPIPNAIVESLLVHLRNLCDILLSRGSSDDDITLKTLLPAFDSPKVNELKSLYGNRKLVKSPCWEINKRLAHSTMVRSEGRGYNYAPMLNRLSPVLRQLIAEVQDARKNNGRERR